MYLNKHRYKHKYMLLYVCVCSGWSELVNTFFFVCLCLFAKSDLNINICPC